MNICYLLLVICYALVLFLGWRLSTERVVAQPFYLRLFPRCDCYWWPADLYCIMRFIQIMYMYFRLDVYKC